MGIPVVFFGCAMRGGHSVISREELRELQQSVKSILGYELASEHQTQNGIIGRENQLNPTEIHDRDWEFLEIADICVFEISNPSLGVGAEIADALAMGKPVLCLYSAQIDESSVSAYIRGKEGSDFTPSDFRYMTYTDINHALSLIEKFVDDNL